MVIYESNLIIKESKNGKEGVSSDYKRKNLTQDEAISYYNKLKPIFLKMNGKELSFIEFQKIYKVFFISND